MRAVRRGSIDIAEVLRELVAHLRQNRTELREEWARRITGVRLLKAMTDEEILAECGAVYDNYLGTLETGSLEALEAYARDLSERIIPRGVETHEVVGIVDRLGPAVAVEPHGRGRDEHLRPVADHRVRPARHHLRHRHRRR